MMDLKTISNDFFRIGNIAILQNQTHADYYDFDFRNYFDCQSIVSETDAPVLLHIGAISNYGEIETTLSSMGMKLLISEAEHLRCSTIDGWYPVLKEKTPYTRIYEKLPQFEEIQDHFAFPVFIKGNRQTSRHSVSKCIIKDRDAYESLKIEWENDDILSWQKVAVREYVPLLPVPAEPYPNQVPISNEFRFFCFEGKCMGCGAYWHTSPQYVISPDDYSEALSLAEWAANRLCASFITVDLAKTKDGRWIIIEVNDAQESGYAEINPLALWTSTINAMQNRTWIPVEEFLPERAVIMGRDLSL